MATLKDLTISIVSHGHGELLDNLLNDLQQAGAIEHCRIIVTINIHDVAFPIEKWCSAKIEWIYNKVPKGFGENHNQALMGASTDWVLILNPDIRLHIETLAEMLSSMTDSADIGIVAPRVVSASGLIEDSVRRNLSPLALFGRAVLRLLGNSHHKFHSYRVSADWFAGMFLLMPSKVFTAVCGFDERYFLYCEDCDICIRVSLLGKRLILDERHEVVHNAQRSSHRRLKYLRWHIISLLKLWASISWWTFTFRRAIGRLGGIERIQRIPDPGFIREGLQRSVK